MKFGIFYEISVPRPWDVNELIVYDNCLEQVKLADELGFDQVWAVGMPTASEVELAELLCSRVPSFERGASRWPAIVLSLEK